MVFSNKPWPQKAPVLSIFQDIPAHGSWSIPSQDHPPHANQRYRPRPGASRSGPAPPSSSRAGSDRKSGGSGTSVSERVDLGGRRRSKKKTKYDDRDSTFS